MKTEMKANLILKPNHPTARDIVNAYTASEMVEKLKDLYCVNDAIATDAGEVLIAATETVEVHINLFGEYPSMRSAGHFTTTPNPNQNPFHLNLNLMAFTPADNHFGGGMKDNNQSQQSRHDMLISGQD